MCYYFYFTLPVFQRFYVGKKKKKNTNNLADVRLSSFNRFDDYKSEQLFIVTVQTV